MIFLFPSDYFNPKAVDELLREQAVSLASSGFETAIVSLESLSTTTPKLSPNITPGSNVIYRGWMLSSFDYELLLKVINNLGANAFTSLSEYLATHYLTNWYEQIADLTPETKFFSLCDDLESELSKLKTLGWERFFIKDYVKSLKTSIGSIIERPSDIKTVVSEMQKFRGTIEGGLCIRRVENFVPASEKRYFVIHGKPFAATVNQDIPEIVHECAQRIQSKFFSIDVALRADGQERIVEIGDGQVSDLVGWSAERFANMMVWLDYMNCNR